MIVVRRPHAVLRAVQVPGGLFGAAVTSWRRRAERARVSSLLAELATPPTVEGVQAALRAALNDPTAVVAYRLLDEPGFVSADGEPLTELADPGPGRVLLAITAQDGRTVALLLVADGDDIDRERADTALLACRPALENARLQADLRARLRAARASRTRIVETAIAERRRLARDLHDGAQQHLHALSASLSIARQKTWQPQSQAAIDTAQDQLRVALSRLRGLGRDLYPAVLDAEGLTAALESLADDGPLDIEVRSEVGRVEPAIEILVYLTVREMLDGLAKYCEATNAAVQLNVTGDRLSVRISSDGELRDDARMADWRSVLIDRIEAAGGEMSIGSEPGLAAVQGGICAEAWIPSG
jgi:signal transduction histidine kinase